MGEVFTTGASERIINEAAFANGHLERVNGVVSLRLVRGVLNVIESAAIPSDDKWDFDELLKTCESRFDRNVLHVTRG